MKPNYKTMNKSELKKYVLENREDIEAIRLLFQSRDNEQIKRYPPVCTEEGIPIEQNIRIMEKAIKDKIQRNNT
jgi:hypothetical protein